MNRWKWIVVLLILGSLFLVVGSTWFGWEPWSSFRLLREGFRAEHPYVENPWSVPSYPLLSAVGALFTLYLSGILMLFTFPNQIRRMEQALAAPAKGLARLIALGLITGVLVAVIGASSALTMGTFPLTIFLGSILFLSGFAGYISLAYALGYHLFLRAGWGHLSPLYALLLGVLILFALGEIPLLGILLKILFISLGIGAIIATRFGSGHSWNLSPLIESRPQNPLSD